MSNPDQLTPLSEAQLEIMNVVWERGEVTVGEVWRTLSAKRSLARNTVLTMIRRLEEKGWLRHRTEGNAFRYTAVHPRRAAVKGLVERMVNTVFAGSAEGLIMTLLEGGGLSEDESERIRAILNKAGRKQHRDPS